MSDAIPLLMLSGMAADERLFEPQLSRFPNMQVVAWVKPLPNESLRSYAARLARQVDPGGPCIVGGASFGGMVALEMASHLEAKACVLIGSVRSSSELPWKWRALTPLAYLGPDHLGSVAGLLARLGGQVLRQGTVRRLSRLARPEAAFVRWAICAVLRWKPSDTAKRVRVFHIHGEMDRTLPAKLTRPDVIVPGGGHALTLTSPAATNIFLEHVITVCMSSGSLRGGADSSGIPGLQN